MAKEKKKKKKKYKKLEDMTQEEIYEDIIIGLWKNLVGGNFDDWECGNTMGLYVKNPDQCFKLLNRFKKYWDKKYNVAKKPEKGDKKDDGEIK
jgi:hypothetical protein